MLIIVGSEHSRHSHCAGVMGYTRKSVSILEGVMEY